MAYKSSTVEYDSAWNAGYSYFSFGYTGSFAFLFGDDGGGGYGYCCCHIEETLVEVLLSHGHTNTLFGMDSSCQIQNTCTL